MRYADVVVEAFETVAPADGPQGQIFFKVCVLDAPAGQMSIGEAIPRDFAWAELRDTLVVPIAERQLEGRDLTTQDLIGFGRRLADLLLPAGPEGMVGVRQLLLASRQQAAADSGGGVRLRLRLPESLAWLPWEYLYLDDPEANDPMAGFLALDPRVAIVRHEVMRIPAPRLEPPAGQLRMAAAFAQAEGLALLDLAGERKALEQLFATRGVAGEVIPQSTIESILANLPDAEIFHFGGHGDYATVDAIGRKPIVASRLLLEGAAEVGAGQLALNLRGNMLRLVVLGACLAGKRSSPNVANLLESVVRELVASGVPAVVANQFTVSDRAAIAFAKGFYAALFGGLSVERAMVAGRLAMYNADKEGREWGSPVLYLRAIDGELLGGVRDQGARLAARKFAEEVLRETPLKLVVEHAPQTVAPPPPLALPYYVPRADTKTEEQLAQLIAEAEDQGPLVVVWGADGVGKGTVVAAAARELFADGNGSFAGGVYWLDGTGKSPLDVLRRLRDDLGLLQGGDTPEAIWGELDRRGEANGGRRSLVVVENLCGPGQLGQLLRRGPTKSRLIAICDGSSRPSAPEGARLMQVEPLTPGQSVELFKKVFAFRDSPLARSAERYSDELEQIAGLLFQLPVRIYSAAIQMVEDERLPPAYLRELQSREGQGADELLEPELTGLPPELASLFGLTSILGAGPLDADLLSRVAMVSPQATWQALDTLARRGLLLAPADGQEGAGSRLSRLRARADRGYLVQGRYRSSAQRLFAQRSPYEQAAAMHLFARACLDRVRQLEQEARIEVAGAGDEYRFYSAFRDRVKPLIAHLRQALRWATREALADERPAVLPVAGRQAPSSLLAGSVLRLFAEHVGIGHLPHLVLDLGLLHLDLRMASLERLVLGARPEANMKAWELLPNDYDGLYYWIDGEGRADNPLGSAAAEAKIAHYQALTVGGPRRELEAQLVLTACRANAIICNAELDETRWVGVRALGCVFRGVRLAGAVFVACDLSLAVWRDCSAPLARLRGSIMRDALLRNVKLRGADLRDLDLTGAVLDEVDLRGANLTGANLTRATLRNVQLYGAILDNVTWDGARDQLALIDDLVRDEVMAAMGDGGPRQAGRYSWMPEQGRAWANGQASLDGALAAITSGDQAGQLVDLRAVDAADLLLDRRILPRVDLRGADLQGAWLSDQPLQWDEPVGADGAAASPSLAKLKEPGPITARLEGASMTAADLTDAWLLEPRLNGFRLVAARLDGAFIVGAELGDADLYAAALEGAIVVKGSLRKASLYAANLTGAALYGVDLGEADLRGAKLHFASLYRVNLTRAQLGGALLIETDLTGCDLTGVDLDDVTLVRANLRGARVTEAQLRRAPALRGSLLPDGSRYMGAFDLEEDLKIAARLGYDMGDPAARQRFYEDACFSHVEEGRRVWDEAPGSGEDNLTDPELLATFQALARLGPAAGAEAELARLVEGAEALIERVWRSPEAGREAMLAACDALTALEAAPPLQAVVRLLIVELRPWIDWRALCELRQILGTDSGEQERRAATLLSELEGSFDFRAGRYPQDGEWLRCIRDVTPLLSGLARAMARHLADARLSRQPMSGLLAQIAVGLFDGLILATGDDPTALRELSRVEQELRNRAYRTLEFIFNLDATIDVEAVGAYLNEQNMGEALARAQQVLEGFTGDAVARARQILSVALTEASRRGLDGPNGARYRQLLDLAQQGRSLHVG